MSSTKAPTIHYLLVTRATKPLVSYSEDEGEYKNFTEEILKEIKCGKSILIYKRLFYICIKDEDTHDIFLMLVDSGFNKPRGFFCLNRIRGDFKRYFTDQEISSTGKYGLNPEFREILHRAYNDFKIENTLDPDEKIKSMGFMENVITENLTLLLERDYRASEIIMQNASDFRDTAQIELNYTLMEDLKQDVVYSNFALIFLDVP